MRTQRNQYLGLFAFLYKMHPADVDRLNVNDFSALKQWADDYNKQQAGGD